MNGWLLLRFVQREVTSRFVGSLLGATWVLLHPMALLLIYSFVFTAILKVRAVGDASTPYTVTLAVCLWPWMAFQESVTRGSQAITANGALINKVPFAHELVVYAAVVASFAVQLVGYVVVLVILSFTQTPLHWSGVPLALFSMAALAALACGVALGIGALQVFVRDLEQALAPSLAMLFYLSPILYTVQMTPESLRELMAYNPIAVHLDAIRSAWLHGRALPTAHEMASAMLCVVVALGGRWVFRRLSPHFEEAL